MPVDLDVVEETPVTTTLDDVSRDDLRTAFRRMKRTDGVQWELETELPDAPKPPPRWAQRLGEWFGNIIEVLTPLFKLIFWAGLAALGLVLLYAIYTAVRGIVLEARDQQDEDDAPEYRPSAKVAQYLLEQADALAAEGRHAEAIHLLLFRSIQDIERARPDAVRLSQTSREIAASPALGARTRTLFLQLARYVERSHFGGQAVGAADYQAARALYVEFAQPAREALPSLLDGAQPA